MSEGSLESRIYRKLVEHTERCELHRALWKATQSKFVFVHARNKAGELAELVRGFIEEQSGAKAAGNAGGPEEPESPPPKGGSLGKPGITTEKGQYRGPGLR